MNTLTERTVRIRSMTSADASRVAELATELGYPNTTDSIQPRIAALSGDKQHCCLVAEAEEVVIGWIHLARRQTLVGDAHAEVAGLVVDGKHRGRGVGAALINEATQWAVQQRLPLLRLRSRNDRTDAHRFYDRLGFLREKASLTFLRQLLPTD